MSLSKRSVGSILIAGAVLLGSTDYLGARDAGPAPGTYRVVDGKVDAGTYAGWFTFNLSCQICHGQDATGTHLAPDLKQSLKNMSRAEFTNKVLARYRILGTPPDKPVDEAMRESVIDEVLKQRRGERGRLLMPVWLDDPGMKPHILDLYAYLKARSDGALGPGRPRMMDE
jgi:hypothetical protein